MISPEHSLTVYATEAEIPRYQRAWVWGAAALGILLCGIAAGWLLNRSTVQSLREHKEQPTEAAALLARQEAANQQLRDRVARLEQALNHDPCSQAALDVLKQGAPASRNSP